MSGYASTNSSDVYALGFLRVSRFSCVHLSWGFTYSASERLLGL